MKAKTAYFDNAATTFPKPEPVYEFMDQFYRECGVNVGRGNYASEQTASGIVHETRSLLLDLFHAEGYHVILQPSATIALNTVLRGLPWRDGMTVYVTPFEHNAVSRTLNYIARSCKIDIEVLAVDRKTLTYQNDRIQFQFQDKPPDIVMVTHASNVCGAIAPLADIFRAAKRYGATTVADMSQTAGLIDVDMKASCADYIIFAGHKTLYGPFGAAGFVAANPLQLEPLIYGGTGIESSNPLMPEVLPIKFEAGSQNVLAIAGLYAALKWINRIGAESIMEQESASRARLLELLHQYDMLEIIEPKGPAVGVISCNVKGYSSDSIGEVFSELGVACRVGLHCSPSAHRFLGTYPAGSVRFSVGYFTNNEDFDGLRNALDYIEENM